MSEPAETPALVLPSALIGRADLARLVREIETVDNDFETQKVRDAKTKDNYSIPSMSRAMTELLQTNNIDIKDDQTRAHLKDTLRKLKETLPIMHMTFTADPDTEFLVLLVEYLRKEIHPQALISVGIQPSLVGGVAIRTPNHLYDFSLRSKLKGKRDLIAKELEALQHAG